MTGVTSYLMFPQKAGQLDNMQPEHATGVSPMDGSMEPSGSPSSTPVSSGANSSGGSGDVESRELP